jgi:hypothetical protein
VVAEASSETITTSILGDVNGDGKIDITDATLIQLHVAQSKLLEGEDFAVADVNGDNKVDITDAKCIVNYLVGKPNTSFLSVAADANCDGVVDIADAVCVVSFVVGNISALAPRLDGNMQGSE